jgi:hypothetical protein
VTRVLDRRHREAVSAWALHLDLGPPCRYLLQHAAGLSRFCLRFVYHRTNAWTQPIAPRSRVTCSRQLGTASASKHASREEQLRPSAIGILHTLALNALSSAVERLGSFPSMVHKSRYTSGALLHKVTRPSSLQTFVDNRGLLLQQALELSLDRLRNKPNHGATAVDVLLLLRLQLHVARPSKSSVIDNSPCAMPCRCMNARA